MKTFWEVLGILFTVIAVASMVTIIVEMARNSEMITFSQALQTIGVPASLLATVCVLWTIRYQHGETRATLNEIAMSVAPEDVEVCECLPETHEEQKEETQEKIDV
jgi:hypothetical protein